MAVKHILVAGVAVAAVLGLGGTAVAGVGYGNGHASETAVTAAAERSHVRVVQADQPVDIGYGYVMALVEEGAPNWVMMPEDAGFEGALEAAKNNGGNIPPDTISVRTSTSPEGSLYGGIFSTPGTFPARVTVETEGGAVLEADLLRLPGNPDWGTYHVDGGQLTEPRATKITAYAGDGTVLTEFTVPDFPFADRA